MTVLGAVSLGSIYVIPLYCAQIQGYNAEQIGYVVMWSGLPQLVLFPAMPFLMKRFDPRILVVTGTLLFAASCFINVNLTHDVGMDQLILPQLLRAAGQPLFTIPLSARFRPPVLRRATRPTPRRSRNMMRNLGGSVGIATLSTMIERREQFHFSMLAEAMTQNAVLTQQRLGAMIVGDAGARDRPDRGARPGAQPDRRAGPPRGLCDGLQRRVLDRRDRADHQPRRDRVAAQAAADGGAGRSALMGRTMGDAGNRSSPIPWRPSARTRRSRPHERARHWRAIPNTHSHEGVVVGKVSANGLRVKFDERKQLQTIHHSYLVRVAES